MTVKERAEKIAALLEEMYPDAACSLNYADPLQLMVATQLAAQCTDERVNKVTKRLFEKYRTVRDFAEADPKELEEDIRPTGFYRAKARNIIAACGMIIGRFNGTVPANMDDLLKLPGVGRKTANLLLNDCFGIPGIVVDTHASRLSRRMGLTENEDPEKIEHDLMALIPRGKWGSFCHQLVFHGRAVCTARKPACGNCRVLEYCSYGISKEKER